jgi:nucleoside permease NupC
LALHRNCINYYLRLANFSSVGMQIRGIGMLATERRAALARLVLKALSAVLWLLIFLQTLQVF